MSTKRTPAKKRRRPAAEANEIREFRARLAELRAWRDRLRATPRGRSGPKPGRIAFVGGSEEGRAKEMAKREGK